jgi:hypothetical protein
VVVFSRDLRDERFKLAGRIHHTNEVMDFGDHAADGRRVRQIDHAADAVEAESFKRLALNAGTPDRAFDLFNRNRRLWHRRLPACLRLRSNRSQLFKNGNWKNASRDRRRKQAGVAPFRAALRDQRPDWLG